MPLPLYGFREGDSIGVLIVVDEQETVGSLAQKLQEATSVRVIPAERVELVHRNRVLDPSITLSRAGLAALDRFDVREEQPRGVSEGC
jgi:Toluene-4-monooxygenase system protein B (TmoB)